MNNIYLDKNNYNFFLLIKKNIKYNKTKNLFDVYLIKNNIYA